MTKLLIEISGDCVLACLPDGRAVSEDSEVAEALADCSTSGDCEDACRYVLDHIGVEFRTVALNAAGDYENRLATDEEKAETCREIYFDSERDFTESDWADVYLVWHAASMEESSDE